MNLSTKIDYANIILIVFSLTLAYLIPFELVLYAYAILGPLHYMTEIDWLKRKHFYMPHHNMALLLAGLAFLMAAPYMMTTLSAYIPFIGLRNLWDFAIALLLQNKATILLLGVFWSMACVLIRTVRYRVVMMLVAVVLAWSIHSFPLYTLLVGLMLPTIVHNYIFTGFFMLYGAFKSLSWVGVFSVFVLVLVPLFVFVIPVDIHYPITDKIRNLIVNTGFGYLNTSFSHLFGIAIGDNIFESTLAIKVQVFLSFTYLYHYLNWFSKTSIIQWHQGMSTSTIFYIVLIWAITTGIHFFDFTKGIMVLYFLAILHVFLEFPLNIHSFRGVLRGFKK